MDCTERTTRTLQSQSNDRGGRGDLPIRIDIGEVAGARSVETCVIQDLFGKSRHLVASLEQLSPVLVKPKQCDTCQKKLVTHTYLALYVVDSLRISAWMELSFKLTASSLTWTSSPPSCLCANIGTRINDISRELPASSYPADLPGDIGFVSFCLSRCTTGTL